MEKKRILLLDSSTEFCSALKEKLESVYELRVCYRGEDACQLLLSFAPDIMVVDTSLAEMNNPELLEKAAAVKNRPSIILTTYFMSQLVEEAAFACDAAMVLVKPCCISAVADYILAVTDFEDGLRIPSPVGNILMQLNIPCKRRGFAYLESCIALCAREPGLPLTKVVYPQVAKQYCSTAEAVERAIRQVIHETWIRRNDGVWRYYFGSARDGAVPRPTNAEMISRLSEVYRRDWLQEYA